jgi:REP element-mobilizing transposase RayT
MIRTMLEYKAPWFGSRVIVVNPAETSHRCIACGTVDAERGRSAVTSLHAHLVFATKYRRRVLSEPALRILRYDFGSVCQALGVALIEVNGEEDQIHLLVQYLPTLQLSQLVGPVERLVVSTSAQRTLSRSRVQALGRPSLESKLLCRILRRRADRYRQAIY